jgi:pimeloyl-ACP methyl ester carboxylesterase
VSQEVFEAYRGMYAYDRTPLEPAVVSVDETSPFWRKETVSFDAAYGDERVIAHLFLPRNAAPPYQPVIWFPGNDVFFLPAGEALASPYLFDFIPRSGRALVYPVYKGTYERRVPFSFAPNETRDMIVLWSKDLGRTVDYLGERKDFDTGKLGFYGFSAGGIYGSILTAVDDRFKASVLLGAGLFPGFLPEANPLNFAPRSRVPTLMINGKDDFITPLEQQQRPLFRLLGAPEADKRHTRLEGGHIPSDRRALIAEVVSWFDRYLGAVGAP